MNFTNFFAAVAMIASQSVDPLTLDGLTVLDWLDLDAAFLTWQEAYHGLEGVQA